MTSLKEWEVNKEPGKQKGREEMGGGAGKGAEEERKEEEEEK